MFYPVVNHGVKREEVRKGKLRTEPDLIQEVESETVADTVAMQTSLVLKLLYSKSVAYVEQWDAEQVSHRV